MNIINNNTALSECSHHNLELDITEIKKECYHLYDPDSYSCDMCNSEQCYLLEKRYVLRCTECKEEAVLSKEEYTDLIGKFKKSQTT